MLMLFSRHTCFDDVYVFNWHHSIVCVFPQIPLYHRFLYLQCSAVQIARSREVFLRVPGCNHVFNSEDYKTGSRQSTLYLPVRDDLMINLTNIEQISFSSGSSFLADDDGIYCRSAEGKFLLHSTFDRFYHKSRYSYRLIA